MTTALDWPSLEPAPLVPVRWHGEWPLLYEELEENMGECAWHLVANHILYYGLVEFLESRPQLQPMSNLVLRYRPPRFRGGRLPPSATPDVMVVEPSRPFPPKKGSYLIGKDGPAPQLVIESLSDGTHQRDLDIKPVLYGLLGIDEYLQLDGDGRFLPQQLVLKRLQPNGTYVDVQDPDGGVTSQLGFRVVLEDDGFPRVLDAATGRPILRPAEARHENEAARRRYERIALERDQLAKERDEAAKERDEAARVRDEATKERDELRERIRELEASLKERSRRRGRDHRA